MDKYIIGKEEFFSKEDAFDKLLSMNFEEQEVRIHVREVELFALNDYSYCMNEKLEEDYSQMNSYGRGMECYIVEDGLKIPSGREDDVQYLDVKVRSVDDNRVFYTQSRFLENLDEYNESMEKWENCMARVLPYLDKDRGFIAVYTNKTC